MTSFLDVIRPLTEQLENLSNKAKTAVGKFTTDASQFQNYVTSNISGATGSVQFLGKGADACVAAVNRNFTRAQHVITKLSDFQLACSQTKGSLEEMSTPFDQESYYHLSTSDMYGSITFSNADSHMTFIIDYFRDAQGYSPYADVDPNTTVIWRIREDTLPGLCWQLDTLLTPGKGQELVEDDINYAVSCIISDFERYRNKRHDDLYNDLHNGGPYGKIDQDQYNYYIAEADGSFNLARHYVEVIAEKMRKGYTEWVTEFQAMVGQFQLDLTAAAAVDEPGLGNLIMQGTTGAGKDAKVLVWQTPNGLIVLIKDGANAREVEDAILAKYGNVPVTLIGYKGGSDVAQQIILDEEDDPKFKVTNLVVIGAPLKDTLPDGINYFSYQATPEVKEEEEGKFLGLKPDQILIPLAATAVGIFTDGLGELPFLLKTAKDVGTEYILAEGWNVAEEWNKKHPGEPMPTGSDSPIYIDTGDGRGIHKMSPTEATLLVNNDPGMAKAKIYFKTSYLVPNEPGANAGDFTNNSYLNSQLVPDPDTGKLPHGGALPVSG